MNPSIVEMAASPKWNHPGGKLLELGVDALISDDLVAILIGAGIPGRSAPDIAKDIFDHYGGLWNMWRHQPTIEDLQKFKGLGKSKAERILAAMKIGRIFYCEDIEKLRPEAAAADQAALLACIIGSGVKGRSGRQIAQDLLNRYGAISGICGHDMGDLEKIKGLDTVKILRIVAAIDLAIRLQRAFHM